MLLLLLVIACDAATYRTPFGLQSVPPLRLASGSTVDVALHPQPQSSPRPQGWIADAVYTASRGAAWFGGSWRVPPLPQSNTGQTLYFFTGLQPTTDSPLVIAQPVLAYQQNAGEGYTLASWFCCTVGHSDPIPASPGDRIVGTITYSNGVWKIVTNNIDTGNSTTLNVRTSEVLNQYYVTLETYGISTCSDYPSGNTTFANLKARSDVGPVAFNWQIQQRDPSCRETALDESKTEIVIKYHT